MERAYRLRGQAQSGRTEADQHIRHSRNLLGKDDSEIATITSKFQPIGIEELVQKAQDAVRQSRETRANSKKLAESAQERVTDAKRTREKLLPRNPT